MIGHAYLWTLRLAGAVSRLLWWSGVWVACGLARVLRLDIVWRHGPRKVVHHAFMEVGYGWPIVVFIGLAAFFYTVYVVAAHLGLGEPL